MEIELISVDYLRTFRESSIDDVTREKVDRVLELREQLKECEYNKVLEELKRISRSQFIVDKNYEDLVESVSDYQDHDGEIGSNDQEQNELTLEVIRHFTNFVSAAKNRENHTRDKSLQQFKQLCDDPEALEEDFNAAIGRFDVSVYGYFFTDLRNILVHEQIPTPTETESGHWEKGEPLTIEREVTFKKDNLRESDEWSSRSLGHMESISGDKVSIREESRRYYEALDRFYEWLFEYIQDEFAEGIDEYEEILLEIDELQSDIRNRNNTKD